MAVKQSISSDIYVANNYRGNLSAENLAAVNSLDWQIWFQTWLDSLAQTIELPQDCEVSLRLVSDLEMQQYNQQYRNLDNSTDVLAFAALESQIILPNEVNEPLYLGDIMISLDTAQKQAREQKHSLLVELAWLSSHGLLHLLGWDHPDDESLEKMLKRQSKLIQLLNTIDPAALAEYTPRYCPN